MQTQGADEATHRMPAVEHHRICWHMRASRAVVILQVLTVLGMLILHQMGLSQLARCRFWSGEGCRGMTEGVQVRGRQNGRLNV